MFLQMQGDVVWNFASDLLSDLVLRSNSKVDVKLLIMTLLERNVVGV